MHTVLVVDDSAYMRSLVKKIVTDCGFTVIGEAENGRVGVEKYKDLNPDIVIMDVVMDELDGLEALKQIISYDNDAIIFMASSMMDQKLYVEDAIALGAKAFLSKPFEFQQFRETLTRYLNEWKK